LRNELAVVESEERFRNEPISVPEFFCETNPISVGNYGLTHSILEKTDRS